MRIHFMAPLLILLSGCGAAAEAGAEPASPSQLAPDPPAPRVDAGSHVRVLESETLPCATEVLGTVDVHEEMKSEEQALSVLKQRAAALGAEAVTGVEFHHGEGGHEETHLSGMAVKCHDLIQGRPYEVVGKIDVAGEMEHEEEAFATLRSRARALNADVITGVHFEHGEGEGQPTHLTGEAIRFAR